MSGIELDRDRYDSARPSDLTRWPSDLMSSHRRTPTMMGKTATGPGFRDLLRSPSGFGGRPGGGLFVHTRHERG
jgi:hypothetical protein